MAPYDGGLYEIQTDEPQSQGQGKSVQDTRLAHVPDEIAQENGSEPSAGRTTRGSGRYFYPVVVIAGVLLLLILAAV